MQFFSFNDPSTPDTYTLSLHDALPIYLGNLVEPGDVQLDVEVPGVGQDRAVLHRPEVLDPDHPAHAGRRHEQIAQRRQDRKSTRLNSSHRTISYAVFCLKKKKNKKIRL